jgi:hypothetical protein
MEVQDKVFAAIRTGLKAFDPVEAITWCGRLNLLRTARDSGAQEEALARVLFADAPELAAAALAESRTKPDSWAYGLNRMPLLELARWAAVLEGGTGQLREPAERRALVAAAQRAGQLSVYRNFATHGADFPEQPSGADSLRLGLTMMRALSQLREQPAERAYLLARAKLTTPAFFDARWRNTFRSATGLEPEDYAACALFLGSLAREVGEDGLPLARFTTADVARKLGRMPKAIQTFLDQASQDAAQLRTALLRRTLAPGTEAGPTLPFDTAALRARPLVRRPDGAWVLVDYEFLDAKLWLGVFDLIGHGETAAGVLGQFGKAVEKYVRRLLDAIAARLPGGRKVKVLSNPLEAGGREITDIALRDGKALVLFEVKSSWVNESTFWTEGTRPYYDVLKTKFAKSGPKQVGVTQLSESIRRIAEGVAKPRDGEFFRARRIYPVMVVQDEQLTDYRHEEALAALFREHLAPDGAARDAGGGCSMQVGELAVAPLALMRLGDLEVLEEREFTRTLVELLELLCTMHPRREVPFSWMLEGGQKMLQFPVRSDSVVRRAAESVERDLDRRLRKNGVE